MRDSMEFDTTPVCEECEQLGANYDSGRAYKEAKTFMSQIRRQVGPEEGTARLKCTSHAHDFGDYYAVTCIFDSEDEVGAAYAYRIEEELPQYWDEVSIATLKEAGIEVAENAERY